MLKLWDIQTGKCLYTWEFTTAIKRVQWSADGTKVSTHLCPPSTEPRPTPPTS